MFAHCLLRALVSARSLQLFRIGTQVRLDIADSRCSMAPKTKGPTPQKTSRPRVMSQHSARMKQLQVASRIVQLAVDNTRSTEREVLDEVATYLKENPHYILKAKEFLFSDMFKAFVEGRTYTLAEADFPNHRYIKKVPKQYLVNFLPDIPPPPRCEMVSRS